MPTIHRWQHGNTSVVCTAVQVETDLCAQQVNHSDPAPPKMAAKNFNGLTGSPMFSCLDADSDTRSPQVPIAVQPDIALDNRSAGDSLDYISSA